MHGKLNILDYSVAGDGAPIPKYTFECNASHVHIYRDGREVFIRVPAMDSWYDDKHKAIVKAMEMLDKAVLGSI